MTFTPEQVVFYAGWSDYEEDGRIMICEKDGEFYVRQSGYSILAVESQGKGDYDSEWELISQEDVLELMLDWADNEHDDWINPQEYF